MNKTIPVKKNYEFHRVFRKGKYFAGKFIILYALKNYHGKSRLGITASKKVGKSVKRNRLRRLIKENYRLYENFVKEGYDLVFVARNSLSTPDFYDIKKEMKFLLKKLNVFDQEKWDCLNDH